MFAGWSCLFLTRMCAFISCIYSVCSFPVGWRVLLVGDLAGVYMTEPWAASRSIMEGKVPLGGNSLGVSIFFAWKFQSWVKWHIWRHIFQTLDFGIQCLNFGGVPDFVFEFIIIIIPRHSNTCWEGTWTRIWMSSDYINSLEPCGYPPSNNKSHLKIHGWKMNFPFEMAYFQVLVLGRVISWEPEVPPPPKK